MSELAPLAIVQEVSMHCDIMEAGGAVWRVRWKRVGDGVVCDFSVNHGVGRGAVGLSDAERRSSVARDEFSTMLGARLGRELLEMQEHGWPIPSRATVLRIIAWWPRWDMIEEERA